MKSAMCFALCFCCELPCFCCEVHISSCFHIYKHIWCFCFTYMFLLYVLLLYVFSLYICVFAVFVLAMKSLPWYISSCSRPFAFAMCFWPWVVLCRVECILTTDSGHSIDAGINSFTLANPNRSLSFAMYFSWSIWQIRVVLLLKNVVRVMLLTMTLLVLQCACAAATWIVLQCVAV